MPTSSPTRSSIALPPIRPRRTGATSFLTTTQRSRSTRALRTTFELRNDVLVRHVRDWMAAVGWVASRIEAASRDVHPAVGKSETHGSIRAPTDDFAAGVGTAVGSHVHGGRHDGNARELHHVVTGAIPVDHDGS